MKKNKTKIIAIAVVAAIVIVTNLMTFFITSTSNLVIGKKILLNTSSMTSAKNINKLIYLDNLINEKYYTDVDSQKMWDTAFKGLLAGTGDGYTSYYTEKEYKAYMSGYETSYSGIGVQIVNNKKNQVLVDDVFDGSPAKEAGLKSGDIIIKIDGKNSENMDIDKASSLIRGKEGSTAKIVVLRNGKKLKFDVKRKKIDIKRVSGKMIGDYGYIKVSEFDMDVADAFEKYYTKFTKSGMKGLVIDLRDNPGGLVNEAEQIANLLLEKDSLIISTTNKSKKTSEMRDTTSQSVKVPVVVLVNENSASASEILSCALQDNKKAKILGTKTFGKGIIQSIVPLNDGSGVTITVEEYISPSGNKIHKKGITPDIKVKQDSNKPLSQLDYNEDNQLREAVKYLKGKTK